MTHAPFSVLIADDDSWAARMLEIRVREVLPWAQIVTRTNPDVSGDFDVCFIDNDFGGSKHAVDLVKEVRKSAPTSLIIVFSGTLDAAELRALVGAGCEGACDKNSSVDLLVALQAVLQFAIACERHAVAHQRSRLGALAAIGERMREWNRRLEGASCAARQ